MTEVTYYQCTAYLCSEWFFSDGSVETATFSCSAIETTGYMDAMRESYNLAIIQSTEYLYDNYRERTLVRTILNVKSDVNTNFGVIPEPILPHLGGCAGTIYGCCPDGITAKKDEAGSNCPCNCK